MLSLEVLKSDGFLPMSSVFMFQQGSYLLTLVLKENVVISQFKNTSPA